MNATRPCFVTAVTVLGWVLLMPPFSINPAGKVVVDAAAPLSKWEALSDHPSAAECRKHREQLLSSLGKTSPPKKDHDVHETLKKRAAAAKCVASNDSRLHPAH